MGFHFRVYDHSRPYFVTLTVVDSLFIFADERHKKIVLDSLRFCQQKKGLEIFAWCLMSNHLHMIIAATGKDKIPDLIRDFKRFTCRQIIRSINEDPYSPYKKWVDIFHRAALLHPKSDQYKMWLDGYHPVMLYSENFSRQKLNYIHRNPVKAGMVKCPWDYEYSSARYYAELGGLLEVSIF